MPFEIPENLHPDCGPIAWLLGTWHGNGHGDYPGIEGFQFGQELIFAHDGRPFFHYFARSWIVDENGEKVREAALETGFWRAKPGGELEVMLVHNTGISEVWYGRAEDGKIELRTAGVSFTETAREVTAGHRLYGNVEGDLLYANDMETPEHPMQPHTWARLKRA